jgi:hypothetical protein
MINFVRGYRDELVGRSTTCNSTSPDPTLAQIRVESMC